jgi:4-amino-4-deoxy-L-arabinose transferase-like glycosyltransferase
MSANPHTGELSAVGSPAAEGAGATPATGAPPSGDAVRARSFAAALRRTGRALAALRAHHVGLVAVLWLAAVLTTHRLAHNGYANTFYSAGVKSMLRSWHNFLFVSFDPGGLITIDKPPLGVWLQAASAWLFGFSPLSLLLPEALAAVVAVAALYRIVSRRLGAGAGLAGALALAVFPSFVAVSRDNGVDTLLILLMLLACGSALAAIETGRWRWAIVCGVLVGLAFNTKTLAAFLVVPGIVAGHLLCARGSVTRRAAQLAVAGLVGGAVSFAWIAAVELTPAHSRPFVGSSVDNTEIGLTFQYNGFGRVQGEVGGPGQIPIAPGAVVPASRLQGGHRRAPARVRLRKPLSAFLANGRRRNPIPFGKRPGPLRLFETGLGAQGAWLLPLALVGLLALLSAPLGRRAARTGLGLTTDRHDPRLAVALVLGGWFAVEAVVLSLSKGIVHPYYVSALAPGTAAMVGGGAATFAAFARRGDLRLALLPVGVVGAVAVQIVLLRQQHYMHWFAPVLIGATGLGLGLALIRKLAPAAIAVIVLALAAAPAAFSSTSWLAPVEGTFPAAGPHEATGEGLYGENRHALLIYRRLIYYVAAHHPGRRWAVLTDASITAAPMILLGEDAGALGGYSGTDPALDGPTLARLVARGEARYVVLGGPYSSRGGNLATKAVLRDCALVRSPLWHGPRPSRYSLALFDCAGHERALAAGPRYGFPVF